MITVELNESSRRQKAKRTILGLNDKVSTFAIMSPENSMLDIAALANGKCTKEDVEYSNKIHIDEFIKMLKDSVVLYFPVKGIYGEKERSFILYNISRSFLEYLGHLFDQESLIFAEKDDEGKVKFQFLAKQISDYDIQVRRKPSLKEYKIIDTAYEVETDDLKDDVTVVGREFSFRIPFSIFSGNVKAINNMVEERCSASDDYKTLFSQKLLESTNSDVPLKAQRLARISLWSEKNIL